MAVQPRYMALSRAAGSKVDMLTVIALFAD